jgi:hypothetical protein
VKPRTWAHSIDTTTFSTTPRSIHFLTSATAGTDRQSETSACGRLPWQDHLGSPCALATCIGYVVIELFVSALSHRYVVLSALQPARLRARRCSRANAWRTNAKGGSSTTRSQTAAPAGGARWSSPLALEKLRRVDGARKQDLMDRDLQEFAKHPAHIAVARAQRHSGRRGGQKKENAPRGEVPPHDGSRCALT